MPVPDSTTPKKDRREAAREAARIQREAEKRRQRRNRVFLQGGVGVGILAVIAVIVIIVVSINNAPSAPAGARPLNMATNGILFTGKSGEIVATKTRAPAATESVSASAVKKSSGDVAHIVTFVDWTCPNCKSFEQAYSGQIADLVKSGKATLEVHPVAILDTHYTGDKFSTRAANAAACVANYDPNKFLDVQTVMYDNQPAEGSAGLTDAQIKSFVEQGGVDDSKVAACIDTGRFTSWVTAVTKRAASDSALVPEGATGFGTPTVTVDGTLWNLSGDFMSFVTSTVAAANQ